MSRITESIATQIEAELTLLANSFMKRTRDDVLRLGDMVARARQGDSSVLPAIGRLAHSIHGSGAMFGFPGVSAAAESMEIWVGAATAKVSVTGSGIDVALLGPLSELIQRLAQETEAADQTAP